MKKLIPFDDLLLIPFTSKLVSHSEGPRKFKNRLYFASNIEIESSKTQCGSNH